jgi:hypothetical protein
VKAQRNYDQIVYQSIEQFYRLQEMYKQWAADFDRVSLEKIDLQMKYSALSKEMLALQGEHGELVKQAQQATYQIHELTYQIRLLKDDCEAKSERVKEVEKEKERDTIEIMGLKCVVS